MRFSRCCSHRPAVIQSAACFRGRLPACNWSDATAVFFPACCRLQSVRCDFVKARITSISDTVETTVYGHQMFQRDRAFEGASFAGIGSTLAQASSLVTCYTGKHCQRVFLACRCPKTFPHSTEYPCYLRLCHTCNSSETKQ